VLQPGHFIDKHCSWPPGPMPSIGPKKCKPFANGRRRVRWLWT